MFFALEIRLLGPPILCAQKLGSFPLNFHTPTEAEFLVGFEGLASTLRIGLAVGRP